MFDLFKVMWRKNLTSYVKTDGCLQKRNSIRNIWQPSRRLYHFRFKCYGPLCDFQWFFLKSRDVKTWRRTSNVGSLAEAEFYTERYATNHKSLPLPVQKLWPIMCCQISCQLSKNQDDRSSGMACTSRTDGQTNKQTDRQTDRQTDERALLECILCKIGLTDWVIYLVDCSDKGQGHKQLVLMTQMKSVQWVEYYLGSILLQYRKYVTLTFYIWPWPFSLTFDIDIWPWDWSIITLMLWRKHYAKTAPHMLERRPTYRLVFCQ